ncbi:MAG: hypothetical protein QG570_488 [Patescibacteria group bacterium]|nr:hypothetical protein [Patescibacteria group bacterium]
MAIQQTVQEPVSNSEVVIEASPAVMSPTPLSSSVSQTAGRYPKMGSFWERFIATLLDSIILGLVTAPFYVGSMGSEIAASVNTHGAGVPTLTGTQAMLQLLSFVIAIGYQVFFLTTKGQTLGKMIMKLKVLDEDNLSKLTVTEVIIRELGKLLSNITLSLGYMWYLIDPKKQTWHDRFSKSLVVKTDDQGVVLMTGNPPYSKNKLAFGAVYGGCCLLWILLIVMAVSAVAFFGKEAMEEIQRDDTENTQTDYNYEYDFEQDTTETTSEDSEFDFEEMLRQYNEQMDEAGTESVPTEDMNQVN